MTDTNDYEANEIRIVDYIDSRMSPAEEELFMQELGRDEGLRQQYENELLMRALLRERRREEVFLQPADEHLRMMEGALRKHGGGYFRWLAAACVFVLCGVLVWLFARRSHPAAVEPPQVVINSGKTPEVAGNGHATEDTHADSVFAQYYTVYDKSEDDPVQVSLYYYYYREKKYSKVVAAKDIDVGQMGVQESVGSQEYLHLYQGLSLLATHDAAGALVRFGQVMDRVNPRCVLYAKAEWYSALACMKNKDMGKAAELAQHLVQTNSIYKQQAEALLQALNHGSTR
jgi:hypothetical protein